MTARCMVDVEDDKKEKKKERKDLFFDIGKFNRWSCAGSISNVLIGSNFIAACGTYECGLIANI